MRFLHILLISVTVCLLVGCAQSFSNEHLLSEDADALSEENGSSFSLRNVQSGSIIPTALNQQGRETSSWQLVPIKTPADILAQDPSGWIQFKYPNSSICLSALGGRALSKSECDINDKETLFILIPSTTRSVQIKSVSSKKCITDQGNDDFFHFEECIADFNKPFLVIPTKNLWMLNPPVTSSPVAPIAK